MAKKKSSRYSPQAGAIRKKEEARKLAERQAKYQQNKKKIWTTVAAVVAAVILLTIAVDFFYTPNGSMRVFFGQLMGVKDNAIVGKAKDGNFYTYGYMNKPEGYTEQPFIIYADGTTRADQDFYYVADDENNIIKSIYVTSVEDKTAEEMLTSLLGYTNYDFMSEAKQATVSGHDIHYIYAQDTSETEETMGQVYSLLAMYINTAHDGCLLVSATAPFAPSAEEVATEEALMAAMEPILGHLTLAK